MFSRHLEFFMQWKTGERKKVLLRGRTTSKRRIGEGVGRRKSRLPEVIAILGNSIRPRTEFLIGAARPYLSIVCQSPVKFFLFYTGIRNRSVGGAAHWLRKKLNISDVGTHQTNNDGETFERGCRVSASKYSLWSIIYRANNTYWFWFPPWRTQWPSPACLEFFCMF